MFHTTWRNKLLLPFIGLASLLALFPLGSASITLGQAPAPYQRLARRIATDRLGVAHPVGLAFAADTNKLLTLPAASDSAPNRLTELTLTEDPADTIDITGVTADRPNLTFDPVRKRLVLYDTAAARLTAMPRSANGRIDPSARVHFPAGRLGLQQVQGMTVDPATGRLFLLDSTGHRLIRLTPDAQGGLDGDAADRSGRVKRVNLPALGVGRVRSLAFNPANGHVYLLNPNRQTLYELSEDGQLLATRDLTAADAALVNPQGMVFAPSGDTTDDPTNMSLYIADSRLGDTLQRTGQIVELSLAAPELVALPQALLPSTLVNTIDTSQWSPPSPDPSGIAYRPSVGRLIVDDGEVEEMSIYQGKNIFESTTSGTLVTSCDTTSFSVEPVGAAVNPANDHLFFSNDDADRVYEINLGQDGVYCTADDIVTSFQTRPFGAFDPEGLAFGQGSLFIGGGEDGEVFQVRPGNNGRFDGVAPAGDDQVTQFDTTSLNQPDNEGIEYNPNTGTLYIVSNGGDNDITEVTTDGTIVNVIETSYINAQSAAGLAMAPSSTNPAMLSLYMVDRGEDNDSDPNENDGRIYEISLGLSANTPTPGPSPTPTNTSIPTNTPIPPNANFYLSVASNGVVGGISANDEDILSFNNATFALVFDGSDVGVTGDVDASYFLDSDTILFSLEGSATIAGLGAVDDFDIISFDATSLGTTTAGSLSLYFDGSDVGLDSSSEDIDALALLPNGQLVISTSGSPAVPGVSGATDEDLLTFTPTALGATTVGTWAMYFDGSDVGLSANNGDIDGVAVAANGDIYLSMRESFTVSSLSGDNTDVLICTPTSLGATTACTFAPTLYFDGSMVGVGDNNVDAIGLPPAPGGPTSTPTNTPTPSNTPTPTNTPTPSNTPTDTPTPTNTPTPSNTPTPTDTPTPTNTPTNTPTSTPGGPTNTPTSTPTNTPINTPTNTPVPGSDLIFADGFETGNFAAWTANKPDNGNLTVITAAALVGSSGMQAVIDDNNSFYVTDDLPNAEPRYRVRFRFDPNSIVMANGDAHYIFYGYIGTSTTTLRVEFRFSAGVYQIRSGLKNDADSWITPAQWVTISDAPHAIELDWRAATAVGANNGGFTLWVDGTQQSDLTGVDNDLARIDRARMGPANSVDAGTRGTYYFDAFESRRQTYIGP